MSSLDDFFASAFAELIALSISLLLLTTLIPFPPPPLAALTIIGSSTFLMNSFIFALSDMSFNPGTVGTLLSSIIFLASILLPITLI